jgi:hypothetical protein
MNPYKLQAILRHVRSHGRLPTDPFGNTLSPDELIVWYELDACLNQEERAIVARELAFVIDAEAVANHLATRLV